MFGSIPKEEAFFDLFRKAAYNRIEGSRLLKTRMKDFRNPVDQPRRIKDIEHIGDGLTHEIARRLNQTFIIQGAGQSVNVFSVDRRDEGLVQPPRDLVGECISDMLDVLDSACLLHGSPKLFYHGLD